MPKTQEKTRLKNLNKDFRAEGMIDSFAQLEKGILQVRSVDQL